MLPGTPLGNQGDLDLLPEHPSPSKRMPLPASHKPALSSKKRRKYRINVGGTIFKTYVETLHRFPHTRLGSLTEGDEHYDSDDEEFFFERNAMVFTGVLDYYRTGGLHVPHNVCGKVVQTELQFWGIETEELADCCWQNYWASRNIENSLRLVAKSFCHEMGIPETKNSTKWQHHRRIMWNIIEYPRSSRLAMAWSIGYTMIMLLSIFVTVFEGMPAFRSETDTRFSNFFNGTTNPKELLVLQTELSTGMIVLEISSSVLLTIDLLLRLIFCPSKIEFFKSILNWLEIISQFMVWYVAFHYSIIVIETELQMTIFTVAMCLRNLRVLRLFRVAKHLPAWRLLILALKFSKSEIIALSAFVFTGVLVFAVLIYSAQFYTDDKFTNVPIGFWWAIVTMTTVGYGDIYPTTFPGYIVGAICAVSGMLATGLPIPLIANNFNMLYSYFKMSKSGLCNHCSLVHSPLNGSETEDASDFPQSTRRIDSADADDCILSEVSNNTICLRNLTTGEL